MVLIAAPNRQTVSDTESPTQKSFVDIAGSYHSIFGPRLILHIHSRTSFAMMSWFLLKSAGPAGENEPPRTDTTYHSIYWIGPEKIKDLISVHTWKSHDAKSGAAHGKFIYGLIPYLLL